MKRRSSTAALAALGLAANAGAWAAPPGDVLAEVNVLLGHIEASGCEFDRNGSWHSAAAAQAHLRDKFDYLAARDLVQTTEQFIERAASQSSLSGEPYRVRCPGRATVTSSQWLHDDLLRIRRQP